MIKQKSYYITPELFCLEDMLDIQLFCSSPAPGGNEDLTFEDWNAKLFES
jgi:hypothetical protein